MAIIYNNNNNNNNNNNSKIKTYTFITFVMINEFGISSFFLGFGTLFLSFFLLKKQK